MLCWQDVGEIRLDDGGDPVFPDLAAVPGVYRIAIAVPSLGSPRVYVGETVSLRMAASRLRNPEKDQLADGRVNAALRAYLASGGSGRMSVAVEGSVAVAGRSVPLDLAEAVYRQLAGNAAQVWARVTGNVTTRSFSASKSVGPDSFSVRRT